MKLVQLIDFLRNRLKKVVLVCAVFLAALVLIDAIPALVDKHHAHTSVEKFPAFWAVVLSTAPSATAPANAVMARPARRSRELIG